MDNTHFTVFIRLPFPRGDFKDPPPVNWDATKERTLWRILSRASGESNIDWDNLAQTFDVSLPFLLQQAAWLYERQLSHMKAQMRKIGKSSSSATASPTLPPGTASASSGGQTMRRVGSSGLPLPRVLSSISIRSKDSPVLKADSSRAQTPTRPAAPLMSRTSSANTIQAAAVPPSPRPQQYSLPQRQSYQRPAAFDAIPRAPTNDSYHSTKELASTSRRSSSSDGGDSSNAASEDIKPMHSQALRRPPTFLGSRSHARPPRHSLGLHDDDLDADDDDENEEDDDSPAFLPTVADPPASTSTAGRLIAPDPRPLIRPSHTVPLTAQSRSSLRREALTAHSSASSASSHAAPGSGVVAPLGNEGARAPAQRLPLSPRRTTELMGRNGGQRPAGPGRPLSDGTPSMGSSFSDLEDTSVTQSALEEALLSNMQRHTGSAAGIAGGMASRMSSISQALRSRYL